jgi:phosphoglycerate dehydrogenase-like enzyme
MKPRAFFAVPAGTYDIVYAGHPHELLDAQVQVIGGPATGEDLLKSPRLEEVELLYTGWGAPRLDEPMLARLPGLRAVFHAAGTIKSLVSDAFWRRGIAVTSAYAANAIPVAEFAQAAIVLSLKGFWHYERAAQRDRAWPRFIEMPGVFRSTVGLVSLGAIGRLVVQHLKATELQIVAYDPYVTPDAAAALGVRMVSLEELFRVSDVVSLHAPLLPQTQGLITGALLDSMKPRATLLNTARGGLIREAELIEVLRRRTDLTAVLDVTSPEPPVPGSPLYELPNVVLTPHVAGSMGPECKRMGTAMAEETSRFLAGQPLRWSITRAQCERMA